MEDEETIIRTEISKVEIESSEMSEGTEAVKKITKAIERLALANYLLDEIMSLLAKGLDDETQYSCISEKDMKWVNRNYKKYNEMG
jgi:hypothetical protein